ncbi:MAG TPA: hypothetical protein VGC22_06025 [Chitinophaga sp.]
MKYERGWKARKAIKIIGCAIVFVAVIGFVVMSLWNWLIPDLFHGPRISFWQAFGLFVLGKLLLGGHHGGGGWKNREHWREKMRSRMENMSEEERNRLRENFRKCGPFGGERFREYSNRFRDRERGQYREPGFPFDDDRKSPEPPPAPGSDMA